MSFNIYKEFDSDTKNTLCNATNACMLVSNIFCMMNFGILTVLLLFLQKEMRYAKQTISDIEYMMPELDNVTHRMDIYDVKFDNLDNEMKQLNEQLQIILIIVRRLLTGPDREHHYEP